MDNPTDVVQLITNVGFPIAICLVLLWYIYYLTNLHKKETDQFTQALNNNTKVLERICEKLDVESEVKKND